MLSARSPHALPSSNSGTHRVRGCTCEYICDFWTASCICVSSALVISTASVKACASPEGEGGEAKLAWLNKGKWSVGVCVGRVRVRVRGRGRERGRGRGR
eukprot:927367-Pleurochrysis_carterae.AAC.1